jgi:putative membrane protein
MKALVTGAVAIAAILALAGSAGGSRSAATRATTLNALDVTSLSTSMQGDLFEVIGGKIALSQSSSPAVKKLAARLILDHAKAYKESATVAHSFHLGIPLVPTPSQRWELRAVSSFTGTDFDRAYTSLETADHTQDIMETKSEIKRGWNESVRRLAILDLPMLKMHLALAVSASKAVNASR